LAILLGWDELKGDAGAIAVASVHCCCSPDPDVDVDILSAELPSSDEATVVVAKVDALKLVGLVLTLLLLMLLFVLIAELLVSASCEVCGDEA